MRGFFEQSALAQTAPDLRNSMDGAPDEAKRLFLRPIRAAGSGVWASLRPASNAFHAEYQTQRHGHIDRLDSAERGGVELLLDMLPR
jgi:hypothetical protein